MRIAVIAIAVIVLVLSWLLLRRRRRGVSTEFERFAAARAMTNRWAEDPSSAPRPVLEIARRNAQPIPEQATGEADTASEVR